MIESYDEFGAEVQLPSKKEICPQCHGEGTHVNPSIDGNGLTYEDFDDDPDFYEDYYNGHYDVVCHTCNGHNVVDVLDEDKCTPEQIQAHFDHLKALWEIEACYEAERRAGC
jgi:RecJ-like exonuclease